MSILSWKKVLNKWGDFILIYGFTTQSENFKAINDKGYKIQRISIPISETLGFCGNAIRGKEGGRISFLSTFFSSLSAQKMLRSPSLRTGFPTNIQCKVYRSIHPSVQPMGSNLSPFPVNSEQEKIHLQWFGWKKTISSPYRWEKQRTMNKTHKRTKPGASLVWGSSHFLK